MDDAVQPRRLPNNNATPTVERAVKSYPARRNYKPYIQKPPHVDAVRGMIDVHCHADYGQQDALSVGQLASEAGMYGILYKSIGKPDKNGPMRQLAELIADLDRWSQETGIRPIKAWAGYALCRDNKPPNREKVETQVKAGVSCFWLALANHANTYNLVGGLYRRWDPTADPKAHHRRQRRRLLVQSLDASGDRGDRRAGRQVEVQARLHRPSVQPVRECHGQADAGPLAHRGEVQLHL